MATDSPSLGNGDWGRHRMHVIEELKQARIERHELRIEMQSQHDRMRRESAESEKRLTKELARIETETLKAINEVTTDQAVTKTKLDARASLFGAGSSLLVIVAYLLMHYITSKGGP